MIVPSSIKSVTTIQVEAALRAEVLRVSTDLRYSPTDHDLKEAFRLGRDIGYNKVEVRKLAYKAFRREPLD